MELETRRLILRPLRDEDAHAMALAGNNINVTRNLARVKNPYTVDDAAGFIQRQRSFDPRSRIFAIAFRCAPDELIGVVSYEVDDGGKFEFGYWLRECCWGMGLMKEAAKAVVRLAFDVDDIAELNSAFHDDNPASAKILFGLGFEATGHRPSFSLAQGRHVPCTQLRLTQQKDRAS